VAVWVLLEVLRLIEPEVKQAKVLQEVQQVTELLVVAAVAQAA
jgi:hypothetical protein